jgi:uracil-DNA glycosylase family 4
MNIAAASKILDDTVLYLEKRKARGVRYLHLNPEVLKIAAQTQRSTAKPVIITKAVVAPKPSVSTSATKKGSIVSRKAAFDDLQRRALACTTCAHLVSFRKQVVFGVGNMDADLMFVGEAPGADEDEQGEPFVGRAGQLLTKMIQAMNFERSDIYIGNVLKCRPNVDTPSGNRKPTPEEMETCIPYLKEQIKIIQPKVLVALGDTAVKGLVPSLKDGITKLRGKWLSFEGIPLMPTFHPAYLLRNQSMALKRQCWEDMLAVLEKLEQPISNKQRNYFLSSGAAKE